MEALADALKERKETVNSKKSNSKTVNSLTVSDQVKDLISSYGLEEEGVARALAEGLGDPQSLGYFRLLANEHGGQKMLEALSFTRLAANEGVIRKKKAVYFLGILRKWGLKTKFKGVRSNG